MPQIPILSGFTTDENSDFRTEYPRNMVPVPKQQGISNGYLRPAEGIVSWATGQGIDRGAIRWNDQCYRVSGSKLVTVGSAGTVTTLADVGGVSSQVSLDYSFDRLGILSDGNFYYWDGSTLTQVTDPDLGTIIDFIWIAGYFMGVDADSIIVTELTDPTAINSLKYGSSELDPDPIKGITEIRNEPIILNRYTIETFQQLSNPGTGFPYIRIEGAQITKGVVGTHAFEVISDTVFFVGGGRGESNSVWAGVNGSAQKIATREIDQLLNEYTDEQLAAIVCESYVHESFNQFHIRLPDRTVVYDLNASQVVGQPVWFVLDSSYEGFSQHLCSNRVWCHEKWIVGHPTGSGIGYLSERVGTQWGSHVGWEFKTGIVYAGSQNALIHELELVSLTGRAALGDNPTIGTQSSNDGTTWSQLEYIDAGVQGDRTARLQWYSQGLVENWRVQRFVGTTKARLSPVRLEARIEGLEY
jgi:hypothetical protein